MDSIKLYIYTESNRIKNCSINIFKIFNTNKVVESSIEECDIAILFVDIPLPSNFDIMLEKLWEKKIILIFCGDSACYFDKLLLNLTNVIAIWSHTIFVDLNLLKKPTFCISYRDYLITGESNSYHQKLKILHTEKVDCMIRSYFNSFDNIDNLLLKDRNIDIACLGTTNYGESTIKHLIGKNRITGMNIVKSLKDKFNIRIGKYSYNEYINICKNTKIFISMQGYGETRWPGDLELAQLGCIIIKNCDYKILTCPNIFKHIIYCNYNFDNLEEILNDILNNIDHYQKIVYKLQKEVTNFDENEHINQILNNIIQSYNKYEINHCNFENIFIYEEHILDNYQIINNNINFYLNSIIDEKQFYSFGFLPITDYYIYYKNKCFQNKEYKCKINFKSNLNKIKYYDGNKWNIILSNNKEFEIEYKQNFSKYIKSRIGFCYENDLKIIEITQLDYSISIV